MVEPDLELIFFTEDPFESEFCVPVVSSPSSTIISGRPHNAAGTYREDDPRVDDPRVDDPCVDSPLAFGLVRMKAKCAMGTESSSLRLPLNCLGRMGAHVAVIRCMNVACSTAPVSEGSFISI